MDISQLIQKQVPLGSQVTFILRTGQQVTGKLIEMSPDHIVIRQDDGLYTLLIDMIGSWKVINQIIDDEESSASSKQSNQEQQLATNDNDQYIQNKLTEIKVYFEANINALKIFEPSDPKFEISSQERSNLQKNKLLNIWDSCKNKYDYAYKINEISAKFGRIQDIIQQLKVIGNKFPPSLSVKRQIAYLTFLSNNIGESLSIYQDIVRMSTDPSDWRNLASVAINKGLLELAHIALHEFFLRSEPTRTPEWYWYIHLTNQLNVHNQLLQLMKERIINLSDESKELVYHSIIYLLLINSFEREAYQLLRYFPVDVIENSVLDEISIFASSPLGTYQILKNQIVQPASTNTSSSQTGISQPQHKTGKIESYDRDRYYGFIRGEDEIRYFFHKSEIVDDELSQQLSQTGGFDKTVIFEYTKGPKGYVAINVSLPRTIDEIFALAQSYADQTQYSKANEQIKKVLSLDPNYPNAQELYARWREYARVIGVPQGTNPYAIAKRVQLIEKDLPKAIRLFEKAIEKKDNIESAVKDLAALYVQIGQPNDAISVLERHRSNSLNPESINNLLVGFYQKAEQFDKAIELLNKQLERAKTIDKRVHFLIQIGSCYLRQSNYNQAEKIFRDVLKLQPHNLVTKRNLALCLFQLERLNDAEKILNEILDTTLDNQASLLLNQIQEARAVGTIPAIQFETLQTISDSDISQLAEFFLEKCTFQGVPPDHLQNGNYILAHADADIKAIEDLASEVRTERPRERAGYYLSAAKIMFMKSDNTPSDKFYDYLIKSFASTGDGFLTESRHINAIQEMYCEALALYDNITEDDKTLSEDVLNAITRYIATILVASKIPREPQNTNDLDKFVEELTDNFQKQFFDMLMYVSLRSKYAMDKILKSLHKQIRKLTFQTRLHQYIGDSSNLRNLADYQAFFEMWRNKRKQYQDNYFTTIQTLNRITNKFEIRIASLEDWTQQIQSIIDKIILDLDRENLRKLNTILGHLIDLCKQVTFEDQDRFCGIIESESQDLLQSIARNPTKLSVESILPLLSIIDKKIKAWKENLYESSIPQISLRIPIEAYTINNNGNIEVQVVIENKEGCSPADNLEIVVQNDDKMFKVNTPNIRLDSSLRGGKSLPLYIPLYVTPLVQKEGTFSFSVYARYRTRTDETQRTETYSFPIRLYSQDDFAEILNPYADYAEGGIVRNSKMFYGRSDLVSRIAKTIQQTQNKCFVIYGQKRAGKSSILYHLKQEMMKTSELFVLDVGNIGSVIDENSKVPILYQILWAILKQLQLTVEDYNERIPSISFHFDFPKDIEFYNHPAPMNYFIDLFTNFQRKISRIPNWQVIRLVVLIDEFQYIYDFINRGLLSHDFMKNWKALLERGFFNVVLVGQDVMTKFKEQFPNEFGITQDEQVSYLRDEDARRLIDEPIRDNNGNSRYREKAIDKILDLTAGSPFYIQIICNRLVQYMNRRCASLVTDADVDRIKSELITGANSLGRDKFDNLINSGDTSPDAISDEDIIAVLTQIAINSRIGPCNRSNIVCETQTSIDTILEDLVRRRVIERERDNYYRIAVGLFREWLLVHKG